MSLIDIVKPDVEKTIQALKQKSEEFEPDPIAGVFFSRFVSVISSAYKRHGNILHSAILNRLKQCERFEAWDEPAFAVSPAADHVVDVNKDGDFAAIFKTELPYGEAKRTLQIDAMVYEAERKRISAYEIKRGGGTHDAGKKRQILRDTYCTQVLMKSYAQSRGLDVQEARSHVIFYYGHTSIPKPFALVREELDEHFQFGLVEDVEEVNEYFRGRLFAILSG